MFNTFFNKWSFVFDTAARQQQILYQFNKYNQISTAYRNIRSLLHDTKQHFFYLQECIDREDYDKIKDYLLPAMRDLENSYNKINTGNLVIDSFISNYLDMANAENISFNTDLQIEMSRIQIRDYDLCVILGNMLDNCMQACRRIIPPAQRCISVQLFTNETEFVIHISNSITSSMILPNHNQDHDSTLQNVKYIVKKYNGNFNYFTNSNTHHGVVTLPYQPQ